MKFTYFNRLDDRFSAVNICVLTPLRALTRSPRSVPARMVNCAVKLDHTGLDIGYVPAGPHAFFRSSGQFGPQQFILCWPAGPVAFRSVENGCTSFFC